MTSRGRRKEEKVVRSNKTTTLCTDVRIHGREGK